MKALLISIIALILIGCDDGKVESIDHLFIIDDLEKGLIEPIGIHNYPHIPDSTYNTVERISCDSVKKYWYTNFKVTVKKGTWLLWDNVNIIISDTSVSFAPNKYELDRDIIFKDIVLDSVTHEYNIDPKCTPISKSEIILRKPYGRSGKYLTVRLVEHDCQATDTLEIDTLLNNSPRIKRLFSKGKHTKSIYLHNLPNGEKDYRVTSNIMVHIDNPMELSSFDIENFIHRTKAIWTKTKTYTVNGEQRTVSEECGESYPYLTSKGEIWANPPWDCAGGYNTKATWTWDITRDVAWELF